jgi:tetratricopeptide (TPR) repeat protein
MRPAWPPAHLLLAIVAERQGRIDRAIEACQQALRLGERRTRVYEQLIQLLYAKSRFSEAEEYLAQLREQIPSSEGLSSMEISLATQAGDMKRALAAAQRGVESRPQDPMARVWLGQVQLASGQTEDAEQTLLAAVKAASTDARAYNALFDFYLRTNKSPQAIQVLEDLEKNVAMSAAERAFVFAQAHERLANTEKKDAAEHLKKAREEYGEAQRLAPDNIAVLERRAAFLFPRDPKEAEAVLRRLLEVEPKSLSARRMLATLLAARGGEKEWQESQSLLETPAVQSTVAEQRLQASLLARRGGKDNFAKARGLLDKITADAKQSVPDDFVLLGQILEAEGRVDAARQQYQAVANRAEAAPAHIAQYVDFLLRHDGGAEAAAWLEKLLQRQPDDLRAIALRARWLNVQQRAAEIEPAVEAAAERLLKKAAETNPAKAGSEQATVGNDGPEDGRKMQAAREAAVFQQIGDIYMAAEQYAAAERWYRRLIQSAPTRYAPLVIALQRQNRLNEAAAVCIEAAKTDASAQPAIVLATAFGIGQPTAADFEIAEPLFAKTLESHPDNVELLNTIAGVRVMQRRLDDAIALYRRIVATKPKDVFALNNLATVLAEKAETRQEAIRAIDSAIDVAGQLPALLDTKGTILILDGKAGDAIPLLKEATMAAEVDSRFLFHLALAYDGAGKGDDAKTTLKKARDRKLAQQILTPTDRRLLDELEKKLGI